MIIPRASNGAGLVGNRMVPPAQMRILDALSQQATPVIVPQLSAQMPEILSDANLYSQLGRLHKAGLVDRQRLAIEIIPGSITTRVTWALTKAVKALYLSESALKGESSCP